MQVVVYSTRGESIDSIKNRFRPDVEFIKWQFAGRGINPFKDFSAYFALKSIVRNIVKATDNRIVLHLHSSKAGFLGKVLSKNIKIPAIYSPNGAPFLRKDINFLKKKLFECLEIFAHKDNGIVVGVSKSETEAYEKIGIESFTINNGISYDNIDHIKYSSSSKEMIIVTSGRIAIQKNPKLFNTIAERLVDKNVKFIWIGDGELKNQLSSSNIQITGWIQKDEVEKILMTADVYISTALWEGLPFAVLEAMNYQLPLILTNCVGNTDLVKSNGFIIETADEAISRILFYLEQPAIVINHGQNSKKYLVEEFSKKKMVNSYRALYKTI
jgi:glycosyltransferase involved in cell wall biosynthesis